MEKIVFKEKEIILSNKTKSFYYLAEKYKDLLEGLINVIELVYFNWYNFVNSLPKIKI